MISFTLLADETRCAGMTARLERLSHPCGCRPLSTSFAYRQPLIPDSQFVLGESSNTVTYQVTASLWSRFRCALRQLRGFSLGGRPVQRTGDGTHLAFLK